MGSDGKDWQRLRNRGTNRVSYRGNDSEQRPSLLVTADLPPIHALEVGNLFRPMLRVPFLPCGYVGREVLVGNLVQRKECPGAHLRGALGIRG